MTRAGVVLVLLGSGLVASQVFRELPWPLLVAAGVALVVFGGLLVADDPRPRRRREIGRRHDGRRGYLL